MMSDGLMVNQYTADEKMQGNFHVSCKEPAESPGAGCLTETPMEQLGRLIAELRRVLGR
jgi:hypothetical protein